MAIMSSDPHTHAERIREQFTRQAHPFAALPIHSQEQSLAWLAEGLKVSTRDSILDAGCGPGLVACYLAPLAGTVCGVDATPAMVAKARQIAAERGCGNATFQEGLMERLPFPDRTFDGVVTRYAFHHVLDTVAAMKELVRVCRPAGRVVVCDAAPRAACRDAYDAWERLRDPSHSSARTPEELNALAEQHLCDVTSRGFRLEADVEALVSVSFPDPGAREQLIASMRADLRVDALDMGVRDIGGRLMMSFPIIVVAGSVPR